MIKLLSGRTSKYLKILASIGLFSLIAYKVELDSIIGAFREVAWSWILLVLAFFPIRLIFQTMRWHVLLKDQGVKAPIWLLFERNWIGRFFSNFLPGRVGGDVYRIFGHMSVPAKISALAASVILDRIVGIISLLLYVTAAGALQFQLIQNLGMSILLVASVTGIVLTLPWLLMHSPRKWMLVLVRRLPNVRGKQSVEEVVGRILAGAEKKRSIAISVLLSLTFHLLSALSTYCSFRAVGIEVNLTTVVLILPLINIVANVPVSFNGLGLREGAFVLMFMAVGVSGGGATAAALIDRITAMSLSLLGGLFYQHAVWRRHALAQGSPTRPSEHR